MSPFLMLYGHEALLAEKIEHTRYGLDINYKKAVAGHIEKMLGIQKRRLYKKTLPLLRNLGTILIASMSTKLSLNCLLWEMLSL